MKRLSIEEAQMCEERITKDELFKTLKSMTNNKSPGNDGFPKKFYETFWHSLAHPLLYSTEASRLKNELSTPQRQAVIKLIEKKR